MTYKIGDECPRCYGTGYVDADGEGLPVDKDGYLALCPYFDAKAMIQCDGGVIVDRGAAENPQ